MYRNCTVSFLIFVVVIFKLDSYFLFKLKGYFLYFTPIVHSMLKLRIYFRLVLIVYTNPNNPVVILRFAISSDSADRGRSIIRVTYIQNVLIHLLTHMLLFSSHLAMLAIKPLIFITFSWSHSLSDFHEIFSIKCRNKYSFFLV